MSRSGWEERRRGEAASLVESLKSKTAGSEIRPYQHRIPLGTMSNVAMLHCATL